MTWETYLEMYTTLNWVDKIVLVKLHPCIKKVVDEFYKPKIFEVGDIPITFETFKEVMKNFGIHFKCVVLMRGAIKNTFKFCENHHTLRNLEKIQKHCSSLVEMNIINLNLNCLETREKWSILEKLTRVTIHKTENDVNIDATVIFKYFRKLETIILQNVVLTQHWSREIFCIELKKFVLWYTVPCETTTCQLFYQDWLHFFKFHPNIEAWHTNHPIFGEQGPLSLPNLKDITFVCYDYDISLKWVYLKDLPKLEKITIITNQLINIKDLIQEIIKNPNLKEIDIYEEATENGNPVYDQQRHECIKEILKRHDQLQKINLDSRYHRIIEHQYEPSQTLREILGRILE